MSHDCTSVQQPDACGGGAAGGQSAAGQQCSRSGWVVGDHNAAASHAAPTQHGLLDSGLPAGRLTGAVTQE